MGIGSRLPRTFMTRQLLCCISIRPVSPPIWINSSPPGENGRHFADDIFKRNFVNENFCISIKMSLNYAPEGPIDNIPALVQIIAWRHTGGDVGVGGGGRGRVGWGWGWVKLAICIIHKRWRSAPKDGCSLIKMIIMIWSLFKCGVSQITTYVLSSAINNK